LKNTKKPKIKIYNLGIIILLFPSFVISTNSKLSSKKFFGILISFKFPFLIQEA